MGSSALALLSALLGALLLLLASSRAVDAQFTCDQIPVQHYPNVKRCMLACEKFCHYQASYCMSSGCQTKVATKAPTIATPGKHKRFTRVPAFCECVRAPTPE